MGKIQFNPHVKELICPQSYSSEPRRSSALVGDRTIMSGDLSEEATRLFSVIMGHISSLRRGSFGIVTRRED